jgi:hypothetical protein
MSVSQKFEIARSYQPADAKEMIYPTIMHTKYTMIAVRRLAVVTAWPRPITVTLSASAKNTLFDLPQMRNPDRSAYSNTTGNGYARGRRLGDQLHSRLQQWGERPCQTVAVSGSPYQPRLSTAILSWRSLIMAACMCSYFHADAFSPAG